MRSEIHLILLGRTNFFKKKEREREKPPQHTRISIVPLLARFSSPGHISYSWIRAPPRAFLPPRGGARWTICLESPRATVFLMYRSVGVAKFSRVYGLGGWRARGYGNNARIVMMWKRELEGCDCRFTWWCWTIVEGLEFTRRWCGKFFAW